MRRSWDEERRQQNEREEGLRGKGESCGCSVGGNTTWRKVDKQKAKAK